MGHCPSRILDVESGWTPEFYPELATQQFAMTRVRPVVQRLLNGRR